MVKVVSVPRPNKKVFLRIMSLFYWGEIITQGTNVPGLNAKNTVVVPLIEQIVGY